MMQQRMNVKDMMNVWNQEERNTWFDLGLFVDKFKENKPIPVVTYTVKYSDFIKEIQKGGIAFISFHFTIDGVTIEAEKYAQMFRKRLSIKKIHYISGQFYPGSEEVIDSRSILIDGRCVWQKKSEDSDSYIIGMEFQNVSDENKEKINSFLRSNTFNGSETKNLLTDSDLAELTPKS